MHGAGRAIFQSPCVVGMRVREHNRAGMHPLKFSQPIKAAIDHYIGAAVRNHQRSVHTVPSCSLLDLAACAEESQFHRAMMP